MKQLKTREEVAGELYREAAREMTHGAHNLVMLAMHIRQMLRGIEKYPGPLWRDRLVPPEGKRVVLDKFEDYLLRPEREGLHFKSLAQVDSFLRGAGVDGAEALALIRVEIPDWDSRVDPVKIAAQAKDTGKVLPPHRPKKEVSDSYTSQGGKASLAGVSRDTQTKLDALARKAPDLLDQVKAGKMSCNAAAIAAGIVKVKTPLDHLKHWWAKACVHERVDFMEHVETCED